MIGTRVGGGDFDRETAGLESEVAGFLTAAMEDTAIDVRDAFRAQVVGAGLGERLSKAIKHKTYPKVYGRNSLEPGAWVYARPSEKSGGAAGIIDSYANGRMIVPRAGKRWLAIATDDCPRKRQGNALTPKEVEARFGRQLKYINPNDRGFRTPSQRHRGVAYLVMEKLAINKTTQRWRKPRQTELEGRTRNPRPLQAVIMFTLVPRVKKPRSVDLSEPAALAEARFPANLDARWR